MGIRNLFEQDIRVELSDSNYVIEKVNLGVIKKNKVKLFVGEGTVALIGGTTYRPSPMPYDLILNQITYKKGEEGIAYLYKSNFFNSINIHKYAGEYSLRIKDIDGVRGKYALIYDTFVELSDYKTLVESIGKTITKEELEDQISDELSSYIRGEFEKVANKYVFDNTTDVDFRNSFNNIIEDVFYERKIKSILDEKGLGFDKRKISLILNKIGETAEIEETLNKEKFQIGIKKLHKAEEQVETLEKDKDRQFELDKIKAENTKIEETTININSNQPINIKEEKTIQHVKTKQVKVKSFCTECGEKIDNEKAKFCPYCGAKL